MRRLVVQSRNDAYTSKRDYQEIHRKTSLGIKSFDGNLRLTKTIPPDDNDLLVGFGGFIFPNRASNLCVTIESRMTSFNVKLNLHHSWNRVGFFFDSHTYEEHEVKVHLNFDNADFISFWGLDLDRIVLPIEITTQHAFLDYLNKTHLAPETYYFNHTNSINIDFDDQQTSKIKMAHGEEIELKKCSYCQRLLPLRSDVLGALSFHKHNAKLTNHQNECRSCKKWRINNSFNPSRTTDQLHESSVITRERKLLLNEPIILQEIKERTGAGLKSQIWEKFNKKCFFCNDDVSLSEFQLDHTRPLAYLWPIDEYATCLCAKHNNQKSDRFPVDFYSQEQLIRLSEITGLSLEQLSIKDVNEFHLNRIIQQIEIYAREWDARTFNAIQRKIIEIRPNIDLYLILKQKSPEVYQDIKNELQDRPKSD